jgi:hypothetical protein
MPTLELATDIVASLCGQFDNGPVASRLLQFMSDLLDLESQAGGRAIVFDSLDLAVHVGQSLERPVQVTFEIGGFELERLDALGVLGGVVTQKIFLDQSQVGVLAANGFEIALGVGSAEATAYGCDLTKGYVDENASYYSS